MVYTLCNSLIFIYWKAVYWFFHCGFCLITFPMPPMLILLISFSCIVFQSHSEAETCTGRWIWQLGPKTLIEAHIAAEEVMEKLWLIFKVWALLLFPLCPVHQNCMEELAKQYLKHFQSMQVEWYRFKWCHLSSFLSTEFSFAGLLPSLQLISNVINPI